MLRLGSFLSLAALVALLAVSAGDASAADKETRGLRYPSLTPDGKTVAFAYRGDIWVAKTDGKHADRLTIHEAQDTLPRISPDGKHIAFSSQRNGGYDLFVVGVDGGVPKRVTFHSGIEIMCEWSPDGKRLLFVSNRDAGTPGLNAFEVPVTGGSVRRLTRDGNVRDVAYSSDGKHIVYVNGTNTIYQDNYEGSGNYDIYTMPVGDPDADPKRVTKTDGNERYPWFSKDGKTIYYVAEEKGVANFYSIPAAGGERTQISKYTGLDVHRPDPSPDGKRVVFERGGKLFHTDVTAKDAPANPIKLTILSDVRHSGIAKRTINSGTQQVHVSKDGRLVFSVHGDLWTMPANGGNAARLTTGIHKDEWPRFSPDGTKVAFQSDRAKGSCIFTIDLKTGKIEQITKHEKGDFFHAWSPDGTKLVFCSERSGNRDIWTIDVKTKKTTQLTKDPAADDDPVFSPDGRLIAFDSARAGNQAIFVMNADGSDVRRVTSGGGFLQVPNFSPDGRFLVYESFNPTGGRSGGLYVTSVNGGPSMQIARNGSAACWSPRGDFIYYAAGARGREEIYRVPAPSGIENREKISFIGTIEVDLRNELANLFDEAWGRLKEGFYDPKMHGVNWDAMKTKYRDMAIDAESKDEFQNVIRQMLAELNASHLGIRGGTKTSNAVAARATPTGYLGLEFAEKPGQSGGRKIASVLRGGPADKVGLRVGDEVVVLNKTRIKADTDIDRLLAGTAGKKILVRYRPISEEGLGDERAVDTLEPVGAGAIANLKGQAWLRRNARIVRQKTGGRVGYIHLSAMNPQNLQKFRNAVASWNQQRRGRPPIDGMVLDVRNNGGGNIHQQLIQILSARPFAKVRPRAMRGRTLPQPNLDQYWGRPVVVLINERSFSDAEVFPWCFKAMELGKVVGVPTPGGVIGTNDITLSDGTTFRIPHVGYFGLDDTNLEGHGVKPHVHVEETAADRRANRDPQLLKAIEVLKADIKAYKAEQKAKKPTTPKQPTTPKATPKADEPKKPTTPQPTPPKDGDAAKRTAGAMDPLADVKKGEWVRYRFTMPGMQDQAKIILKVKVVDIVDGNVIAPFEVEEGPPLNIPLPEAWPNTGLLESLTALGPVGEHSTSKQDVKGDNVDVAKVFVDFGGGQLEMHVTNAVPALGVWRVKLGEATLLEALEWGVEEVKDSEKPATDEQPATDDRPMTDKPVTDKPVPGPSAATPSTDDETTGIPHPLRDAKVGEWIKMRNVVQGQETVSTLRVVAVTADEVHIKSEILHGDTVIRGNVVKHKRRKTMPLRGKGRGDTTVSKETIEIGGKSLDCHVITFKSRRGTVSKRWICGEIPVNGLVKRERDGKVVSELLEWGVDTNAASEPANNR